MLCDGSAFTRASLHSVQSSLDTGLWAFGSLTAGDRDAAAYIALVEIRKGSAVTEVQKTAITDFIKAEKAANRWGGCIYLPIWGVAAANAIDMVSLRSGSWVGAVTHAAGYAQGNGSFGYFNTGTTMAQAGATATSQLAFVLATTVSSLAGTRTLINAWDGAIYNYPGVWITCSWGGTQMRMDSVSLAEFVTPYTGIITNSRISSTSWAGRTRRSSGVTSIFTGATTPVSGLPSGTVFVMAAKGNGGLVEQYTDAKLGCFGFRSGLSVTDTDSFTLNLKTLWESCTGLTLDWVDPIDPATFSPLMWFNDTGSDRNVWSDVSGNNRHLTKTSNDGHQILLNQANGRQCRRTDFYKMSNRATGIPSRSIDTTVVYVSRRSADQVPLTAPWGRIFSIGEPDDSRPDYVNGLQAGQTNGSGAALSYPLAVRASSKSVCDHGIFATAQNKNGYSEASADDLFEIIVIGRFLTVSERTGVTNWLKAKYAIP